MIEENSWKRPLWLWGCHPSQNLAGFSQMLFLSWCPQSFFQHTIGIAEMVTPPPREKTTTHSFLVLPTFTLYPQLSFMTSLNLLLSILVRFWERISVCSTRWPQTHGSPAFFTCLILGSRVYSVTSSLELAFWWVYTQQLNNNFRQVQCSECLEQVMQQKAQTMLRAGHVAESTHGMGWGVHM